MALNRLANRFVANADAAINFKLVRSLDDVNKTEDLFHPEFSHQFFGEQETIFGYSNLAVNLRYCACTLEVCLETVFDKQIDSKTADGVQPDDIIGIISKQLPEGSIFNMNQFTAYLAKQKDFRPFGSLIHSYDIEKEGRKRTFQIFKIDEATPAFISHYQRMETFALWFIDAASFIDTDDPAWKYYVVYEKYRDADGNTCFAFCGYSSVYHYYAYPEHVRPRVGHILVLPPFQKCGHGVHLLQTIYNDLIPNLKVLDITAEDPSVNFVRLRDYVDCMNCSNLSAFQPDALKNGFSVDMATEARDKLKITKRQARRIYEILRFKHTNRNNAEEFRNYRLDVKRRLYIPFQKNMRDWSKLKKALNPQELVATVVGMNPEQRMLALQEQFDAVLMDYQATLQRLAQEREIPAVHMRSSSNKENFNNGKAE